MRVKPSLLDAELVDIAEPDRWVIHRCFVYSIGGSGSLAWRVDVHIYQEGPIHYGFTEYIRRLCQSPGVLDDLIKNSASLPLWGDPRPSPSGLTPSTLFRPWSP
jgi:hypothetical protein